MKVDFENNFELNKAHHDSIFKSNDIEKSKGNHTNHRKFILNPFSQQDFQHFMSSIDQWGRNASNEKQFESNLSAVIQLRKKGYNIADLTKGQKRSLLDKWKRIRGIHS